MFGLFNKRPQGLGMFGGQPETYEAMGGMGQQPGMGQQGGGFQMRNPMMAMAGLGMLSGKNNREAFSGGLQGAILGAKYGDDLATKQKKLADEQAEIEALAGLGLPEGQLKLAQKSPTYRSKLLEAAASPKEAKNVYTGTDAGVLNQQTGELTPFTGQQALGKAPQGYRNNPDGTQTFIPGGPADPATAKPTEAQKRNEMLYKVIEPEVSDKDFDTRFKKLADWGDGAANAFGLNAAMSADAQRANGSLRTIISSYLYSVSGATANPGEVENQATILTPKPTDDPKTVEDKLRRVKTMVDAVRQAAGAKPHAAGARTTATGVQYTVEN